MTLDSTTAQPTSRLRPGLRLAEVQHALTFFNWSGGFRGVFDYACGASGFIFTAYALALGIPKESMGLFAAFGCATNVLQLAALWVMNHVRRPKAFTITLAYAEVVFCTTAVLLGLFVRPGFRFWAIAGLLMLGASASALIRPTTDAWLASSIPERLRGRYLGLRYAIVSAVGMVTSLGAGQLAERIPHDAAWAFALLLLGGCLFGLAAVVALQRVPMLAAPADTPFCWADLAVVLRDRPFMRYLIGLLLYDFPFFIGPVYYAVFHLEVLHMGKAALGLLAATYLGVKIVVSPLFGYWIDRLGPRLMIYLVSPLYLLLFVNYALVDAPHAWLIFVGWGLAGVSDGAFGVAIAASLYSVVPDTPARNAYFAVNNLVMLSFTAIGAAIAAGLVAWLKGKFLIIGPVTLTQFQLLFAGCAVFFTFSLFATSLLPGKRR